MKLDQLQHNYCIKMTRHIKRYYFSVYPIINRNEIDYYEIKVGNSFKSNCITLTEILKEKDEVTGIRFSYNNEDDEPAEKDATLTEPARIKIITGSPRNYLVQDITFEIIPKDENTIIGAETIIHDLG